MVSGPNDAFRAIRPALEAISSKIVFVSEIPGQGQMVKLVNNILSAAALAITAEAVVLGVKAGLDVDMLLDVVNSSSGRNSATAEKFPRSVLPRKFDAFGRTDIIYKDVCLCLEQAEALGVPMWVGNSVKQLFGFAISQGGAKREMTTLVKYLEAWAGVEVRGKDAPSAAEERKVSPVRLQ
jgi:3-hydroxyisobutyrate dehydrogenase-like beta-hydroxyacid dehydrogenase